MFNIEINDKANEKLILADVIKPGVHSGSANG